MMMNDVSTTATALGNLNCNWAKTAGDLAHQFSVQYCSNPAQPNPFDYTNLYHNYNITEDTANQQTALGGATGWNTCQQMSANLGAPIGQGAFDQFLANIYDHSHGTHLQPTAPQWHVLPNDMYGCQQAISPNKGSYSDVSVTSSPPHQHSIGVPDHDSFGRKRSYGSTSIKSDTSELSQKSSRNVPQPTNLGNSNHQQYSRNAWGNETYIDLIVEAITSSDNKRMTLAQLYKWFAQRHEYFGKRVSMSAAIGWKNSVRHTLSANACFVRQPNDSGHHSGLWTYDPTARQKSRSNSNANMMNNNHPVTAKLSLPTLNGTCEQKKWNHHDLASYAHHEWHPSSMGWPEGQQIDIKPSFKKFSAGSNDNALICGERFFDNNNN